MMTDPISDMLTRMRNALNVRSTSVDVRLSKMAQGIARVLKDEGYITDFKPLPAVVRGKPLEAGVKGKLRVYLKYGPEGEMVITEITRQSKPSRRIYRGVTEIPRVCNGLGIAILSTPRGVLSDRECRREKVGGELLCIVA